jgi:ABC-2 type transport system permease protein
MESLQYIMNILMGFVIFFIVLFVFLNLWQYIYSDPGQLIDGYTMNQTIWYVILTEIIWFGTRNNTITSQISNDIKSGSIAYVINKPYHYILYMITRNLAEIALKFFLYLGAGLLIGYLCIGSLPGFHPGYLPLIIPVFIAGTMINIFLTMSISVLSFWIEDAAPFHWIYIKIILILGILFPIEMFPAWAQPIIKCTPIYVVTYGPAKLVIDFDRKLFLQVILTQGIYLAASFLLLMGIYRRGVKKINVNGG